MQHFDQCGDVVAGGVAGQLFEHRAFNIGHARSTAAFIADRVGDQKGKGSLVNGAKDALVGGEHCGQQDDAASSHSNELLATLQGTPKLTQINLVVDIADLGCTEVPNPDSLNVAGIEIRRLPGCGHQIRHSRDVTDSQLNRQCTSSPERMGHLLLVPADKSPMPVLRSLALTLALGVAVLPVGAMPTDHSVSMLQEDAYIIGPGDVMDLKLFDAEELSGALEVLNDGSVPLPLVGSVRLSGLTLQQATLRVQQLISEELLRPDLQLRVVKPRPIRVALVGQVERPGIYSLTTSETGQTEGGPEIRLSGLPTVVDAIQKAGGITQNANLRVWFCSAVFQVQIAAQIQAGGVGSPRSGFGWQPKSEPLSV